MLELFEPKQDTIREFTDLHEVRLQGDRRKRRIDHFSLPDNATRVQWSAFKWGASTLVS
jgi:hypothetical protein